MKKNILILITITLVLSACSLLSPKPTPTPEPTATTPPKNTPVPTPTPEPSPTPETLIPEPIAEREEGRHYEENAKFSYIPIEGWEIQEFPGLTTNVLIATDQSSLGVNLVFVPEPYNGSTKDYAKLAIETAKPVLENFVEGEYSYFETDSGLTVVKLPARYRSQGLDISGIFYMIGDDSDYSKPKLTITLTKFLHSPATIEAQVESLIKSVRFEN